MRSDDVLERVRAKLTELGVPQHISHAHKVASCVRVQLIIRNTVWRLDLRKGITGPELDHKLAHLTAVWDHARPGPQLDIEEIDIEAYQAGVAAADRMDIEGMVKEVEERHAAAKAAKK